MDEALLLELDAVASSVGVLLGLEVVQAEPKPKTRVVHREQEKCDRKGSRRWRTAWGNSQSRRVEGRWAVPREGMACATWRLEWPVRASEMCGWAPHACTNTSVRV